MKRLLMLLTLLIPVFLVAQGAGDAGILYTLANGTLTSDAQGTYYEFDVMAQMTPSNHAQTRLGTGIFMLEYSWPDEWPFGSAFGTYIEDSGNVVVSKGTLLQDLVLPPPYPTFVIYTLNIVDSTPHVLSVTFLFEQTQGMGAILPVVPTQLVHIKMTVQNPEIAARVCFWPDLMVNNETFYDDEATWYDPIETGSCITQDPPLPVELSYFSCVMSNTNAAVNLTWVTQTETNMVGFRVIRGESNVLEEAVDQGVLVAATNTSNENVYYWSDTEILSDHTYNYWLEAQDMDGTSQFYGPTSITTPSQNINAPNIPLATGLTSIYPNPFNPDLTIHYTLERSCPVQIYITNIRGQIVKELVNAAKDRGTYKFIWDGTDSSGRPCSSGVFYIKMLAGGKEYNKKAVLLK